ncbi:hypothetical protein COEREDRAFT_6351 [Coemansia reversa NRRL 1564]|uniref:Amino acid transporter transmembrane domain-containing protein n=1 Tax=Coemansia reversa (strain ATCC 12441 / NRRL 1564) TaxID=763665 RepID=A0A2G5BHZ8_COERN|nr:hypothetical protein COEREDRAFT_6351 [Coemansia reversa NRRL 1564]|eukprot:PIA18644.1 hypothetical protein COEREDRAFT_6351 [Coemansia reversa NRRL 1564]
MHQNTSQSSSDSLSEHLVDTDSLSIFSGSFKDVHAKYDDHLTSNDNTVNQSSFTNSRAQSKGSTLGAFLNILCLAIGVGSLQLAYTVKQSGWFGIIFIVFAAGIAFINAMITVKCMYLKPGGGRISNYHEIGFEAFGKVGYYMISSFNVVNIIGSIGIYTILASNNTADLFSQVNIHISPRILMVVSTLIMCIPALLAKTLAETFIVSLIGTATSVVVTIIVIVMACLYPIRDGGIKVGDNVTHTGAISHFGVIPGGFAMALSSVSFAYLGTTIVPHIEGGMRRPEKFRIIFGSALTVIAAIYVVMAATGYWAYGDQTLSPITQNFPKLWPTTVANISMTIHVLFSGPLYLVQMALEIEDGLAISQKSHQAERIWRLSIRAGSALMILAISEAIPFFDDVISLVGALTNPVLIYLAPIACYVKLRGWRNCSKMLLLGLGSLLAFGMAVSGFGLVQTIIDIVESFKSGK